MPEIKTPPNMPRIVRGIKFWPYRHFFDPKRREGRQTTQLYRASYSRQDDPASYGELDAFREQLAVITSPEHPMNHIDNHSGWEVELKNGTTAFVLYSDFNCTMFSFPPAT